MYEVNVDLDDVKEFVISEEFSQFLLSNTADFATAVFVLQTLLDRLDELGVDIK